MILHFPERLFLYSHSPTVNFQDISYYQSLRYNIFIRQLIILKRIKEMFNFYLLGIVVLEGMADGRLRILSQHLSKIEPS